MSFLMLAIAIAQDPLVMVREPRSPTSWNLTTQAVCHGKPLLFSGYGASVRAGATPKVTFGGRPLTGPGLDRLIADLSTVRAAYRFSVKCDRTGEVTVRVYEGEAQRDGTVRYRSGAAVIRGNAFVSYSGLEEADADSFWFR